MRRHKARLATGMLLFLAFWLAVSLGAGAAQSPQDHSLGVLTLNAWSGLDYIGTFSVGDYEARERRDKRFAELVRRTRELDPDVIFLQEVNPAGRFSRRLADALGYDQVHQVTLSGIKIAGLGIPSNLCEGNAILAKPGLGLRKTDSWRHSGSFGFAGGFLSFHLDEIVGSLVAEITAAGTRVDLVNVHLHATPTADPALEVSLRKRVESGELSEEAYREIAAGWTQGIERRAGELRDLDARLKGLDSGIPLIVAGDFNAPADAPEIAAFRSAGPYLDAGPAGAFVTWDPSANPNVAFSAALKDARGQARTGLDLLGALDSALPRRLDYIFLGRMFAPVDVMLSRVVFDGATAGLPPSDHYGLFALVDLDRFRKR
jgi:endonuclease/exonuclease/phosphatase family metal-dependent hydrolase